jgi:hypothetical protein
MTPTTTTMTNQRIIYSNTEGGVSVIIPTGELSIEEVAAKDVPEGVAFEIVTTDEIPSDRTFRGAWVLGDCCVEHDLDKCKEIGHDKRRAARAEEFQPYDEVIAKQIPGVDAAEAEAARQAIRDKYTEVQANIDAAETPDEIKAALEVA